MAKMSLEGFPLRPNESPPTDWKAREAARFTASITMHPYEPVPWASELWAVKYANEHFPHLSKQHKGMIAYTPNREKGEADLQVPIRPGRYLKKYYPDMTTEVMSKWSNLCFTDNFPLVITKVPQLIRDVYRSPSMAACMSHAVDHYISGGLHPTSLYASSPDLALAYIHEPTIPNRFLARAIVWPDKKIFSRIYGNYDLMTGVLLRNGWKPGTLDGARLQAIHQEPSSPITHASFLVCPFIDHLKWACLHQDDSTQIWWLILQVRATGATHSVQHTNGVAHAIGSASRRPYGVGDPQRDWLDCITAEGTPRPNYYPNGNAISIPSRPTMPASPRVVEPWGEADWRRARDLLIGNHVQPPVEYAARTYPTPSPHAPGVGWDLQAFTTNVRPADQEIELRPIPEGMTPEDLYREARRGVAEQIIAEFNQEPERDRR